MRSSASRLVFTGVTLVTGLALGAGVALTFFVPTTPQVLESSDSPATVPVTTQEFSDPQPVDIVVSIRPPEAIAPGRSGTVTAWSCAPGATLESGKSSVAVDGVNLINLSTTVPPWRDLTIGAAGADVSAVEQELARLGYAVQADGKFSRADLAAATELAKSVGTRITDTVPRDVLVWLPASTVQVEKCDVGLGGAATGAQALAWVSTDLAVAPVSLPEGRIPGARVLEAFGDPIPLGDAGELPADLSSSLVRDSPAFREASGGSTDDTTVTLKGKAMLAEPVPVAAVPATSVLVLDNETACVFTASSTFAVQVVGSEFGNSFVRFVDTEQPRSVLSSVPDGKRTCS